MLTGIAPEAAPPAPYELSTPSNPPDVLSAFLKPCRVESRHARWWRLTSPWGLEFTKGGPAFIAVLEGACLLRLDGSVSDTAFRANDFALLTRPTRLVLCDRPASRLSSGDHLLEDTGSPSREAIHLGGGGVPTRIVWANLNVADEYTRQAFALLPALVMAAGDGPDASGLAALTRVLLDELPGRHPGGEVLADRALHALLVYALRAKPLTLPSAESLVPALNVPGMGMALAAIHSRPEHEWSVRELARLAGLSRSKFAVRFVEVFGTPPFDYLRDVRMRLACRLLRETDLGIKEISARAGYATEASFSRAFSQWCGCAPGAYRRRKQNSPSDGEPGSG
jgi:AraC-like DNA-binding protein